MKIVKKTLSEQIYEILRSDILSGKIPLGEKLINRELQERFEVSSTPVRDAVNHLYQDGLITEVTKVGAQVVEMTAKLAFEINEILSILSCAAIKMAFDRTDSAHLTKELKKEVALQEKCIATESYFLHDYAFHKTFFHFAKNENCLALFERYHALHEMLVRYYHNEGDHREEALAAHKKVIAHCEEKNWEAAQREMDSHYRSANATLEKKIEG